MQYFNVIKRKGLYPYLVKRNGETSFEGSAFIYAALYVCIALLKTYDHNEKAKVIYHKNISRIDRYKIDYLVDELWRQNKSKIMSK